MKPRTFRSGLGRAAGAMRQRGAATLIVVSLLFFVLSLVAAYANRNLIFEQRTSANQLRSTLAFETADAGVEWAVAMLNAGRIDATCLPVNDTTATSFRDRYLDIDASTGVVTPRANLAAGSLPTCVYDGAQWLCSCPVTGAPSISGAPTDIVAPAFRLRFVQNGPTPLRPGTISVEVQACTRLDDGCLASTAAGATAGEGRAKTSVLLALRSGLPSPPVATLTARGTVNLTGSTVRINNAIQGKGRSLAVQAGGALTNAGALVLSGAAGELVTASAQVLDTDGSLDPAWVPVAPLYKRPDHFFGSIFGIQPDVFRDQPASLTLVCSVVACDADRLRTVAARNPGRFIWAVGDVNLDGGAPLGSAADPVMLVVTGDLTASDIQVNGLIYGRKTDWSFTGTNTRVLGAVMAESNLVLSGTVELTRDADILNVLRWRHGSFVRVPGGWSDY